MDEDPKNYVIVVFVLVRRYGTVHIFSGAKSVKRIHIFPLP